MIKFLFFVSIKMSKETKDNSRKCPRTDHSQKDHNMERDERTYSSDQIRCIVLNLPGIGLMKYLCWL